MSEDNIKTLTPKVTEIAYEHRKTKRRLWFDDRYLYEEWGISALKGNNSFLLHRLSPNIVKESISDPSSVKKVQKSFLLFTLSVVIYYSDYQSKIPLLAPALFLYGSLLFFSIKNAWPRTWVSIYDDFNYKQAGIVIPSNETPAQKDKREAFIGGLKVAIETARSKEYYGE